MLHDVAAAWRQNLKWSLQKPTKTKWDNAVVNTAYLPVPDSTFLLVSMLSIVIFAYKMKRWGIFINS